MLDIITTQWHPLLSGLWNTILCSLIALVGSLIIGTFFALLEISKYRIVRLIGSIYVEVFRNIPLLVISILPPSSLKLFGQESIQSRVVN